MKNIRLPILFLHYCIKLKKCLHILTLQLMFIIVIAGRLKRKPSFYNLK